MKRRNSAAASFFVITKEIFITPMISLGSLERIPLIEYKYERLFRKE